MKSLVWLAALAAGAVFISTAISARGRHASPPVHWQGLTASGELSLSQVTIMNPGLLDGNDRFGGDCDAMKGSLRVLAVDARRLLVRYTRPGEYEPGSCPTGTLFFVSKDDFRTTQRYTAEEARQERQAAAAERQEEQRARKVMAHVKSLLASSK